ncbi:MAG: hypothetical protein ACRC5A_03400 [Enterobacteriaceae bacterium]
MANLRDLAKEVRMLKKQVPYAISRALTSTIRQIEAEQKKALEDKIDRPTPFTVKSIRSVGARRDRLTAKLFMMRTAAEYMEPYEIGGVRKLNSKALLNPKEIRLNKYGNLPAKKLTTLKGKSDVFIGTVATAKGGKRRGVWKRYKYQKVKKRRARSANGTRQERIKQRDPKLLIQFGDALPVQPILGYQDRAKRMAAELLPVEMEKALDEAIRTAK